MDLDELTAVARRACALLDEGQVEVRADRALFVAVRNGRGGRAEATALDDASLQRAAKAARVHAGRMRAWPVPPLPEPAAPTTPATPATPATPPAPANPATPPGRNVHSAPPGGPEMHVPPRPGARRPSSGARRPRSGARRGRRIGVVVASTTGVLAAEEFLELGPPGSGTASVPAGPCVLGPAAVAGVLHALRNAFGVDAALGGLPDVRLPACVTLVDDAAGRRRFDAEGTPRRRVVLVDGGVPVAHVRDAASAPSTGHATLALTLAPRPDDLRLEPGDADLRPTVGALRPLTREEALHVLGRVVRIGRDSALELR